jgi:hypothetical protein
MVHGHFVLNRMDTDFEFYKKLLNHMKKNSVIVITNFPINKKYVLNLSRFSK